MVEFEVLNKLASALSFRSLGCLVIELLTGRAPWKEHKSKKICDESVAALYGVINNDFFEHKAACQDLTINRFLKLTNSYEPQLRSSSKEIAFVAEIAASGEKIACIACKY